jgi:MATE family multidrug resistance protein
MNREILRLAIPNIISNVSVPLLSTVDTVLMGQLSGIHLGAVGIGSMIFNFLYWNFGFLRMGTTGLTAQAFGREDHHEIMTTLGRALVTGLLMGLFLILVHVPVWKAAAILMNVSEEHYALVRTYFVIRMMAAPATFALFALMGWFFGMQNAVFPLVVTVFLNIINIGISALLVLHFDMEVKGVAYGTLAAQYFGLLLALGILINKYRSLLTHLNYRAIFIKKEFFNFFKLNKDIFLRTVCLSLVFAFFYSQSSKYGELILAASVILMQFMNWMSYGIDGFAFAAESMTGKYHGASNKPMLFKTIKYAFFWGAALSLLYALVYWIGESSLINLFTSDEPVKMATSEHYIWIVILPVVGFASYIWDGVYVGLTAVKSMRNSMFLSFLFFFATFFFLRNSMGPESLWISLLVFLLARGLFQTYLFIRYGAAIK